MEKSTVASVIITTYNWAEALNLTIQSLLKQNFKSFEIIVADDGSGDETAVMVREILGSSGLSWRHVRHDHRGARQSRIKNLAVHHSQGQYLIFVDHDTVLHPDFVRDHLTMASEGTFLQGKRVLLSRDRTMKVLRDGVFKPPRPWNIGLTNRKNSFRCKIIGSLFSAPKPFHKRVERLQLVPFPSRFSQSGWV